MTAIIQELKETKAKIRLLAAKQQLQKMERQSKRVMESQFLFDWVSGYQDLLDRLRSPDGAMLSAVSVAADRAYGANWPFWRTWQDHAFLRGAARVLCETNNQAKGALNGLTNYVIDVGFQWHAREKDRADVPEGIADAVMNAIDEFTEHNLWAELEKELFKRSRRDGEYFIRAFVDERTGLTSIRTAEPEQIVENPTQFDITVGSFGIINAEHDVQHHIGYLYSENGSPATSELVTSEEMQHVRINVDRAIKRGLTDFCFDTYDLIKSSGRLISNMAEGSAIQASIALIRQHEVATPDQVQAFVDAEAEYQVPDLFTGGNLNVSTALRGSTLDIGKGFNYVAPPYSQGAGSHAQVAAMIMRAVAARWNAPEWLISGDSSNNNYASSLTAESPFVKTCKSFQAVYGDRFRRVIRQAVRNKAEMGMVRSRGRTWTWEEISRYVDIDFTAPTIETRNKLEEAQTYSIEVQNKVTSPQIWAAKVGNNWEQVAADLDEIEDRFGQDVTQLPIPGEETPMPGDETQEQELLEDWDEGKHKRAADGKFGSGGGSTATASDKKKGSATSDVKAKAKEILTKASGAIGKAEHAVVAAVSKNVEKLPTLLRKPVKGVYNVAMLSYSSANGMVEAVAKAKGLEPEKAHKLASTLAAMDVLLAKPAVIACEMLHLEGLTTLTAGFTPIASSVYLGYSAVTNPASTLKAATEIVGIVKKSLFGKGKPVHESKQKVDQKTLEEMVESIKGLDATETDWFLALASSALDQCEGDLKQALQVAKKAFEKHPKESE